MKARVQVTLKAEVLDPQGKAIRAASAHLGVHAVTDVRQGKLFDIALEAGSEAEARQILSDLGGKLLSNPVIEDYEILSIEVG